jgi:hypothetical protein
MNKIHLLLTLGLGLLFLTNCTKKTIPQSSDTNPITTASGLTIDNTDFLYFSSKANIHYKDDDEDLQANALLRMKKDSIIWINVNAGLGIEALRAIITPDSIVVVDKIKKRYVVYDFASLSKRYNFNLDFKLLQDIILGNLIKEKSDSDMVTKESTYVVLTQKQNKDIIESFINQNLSKVQKLQVSEPGTSNLLSVDYSGFEDVEGRKIPKNVAFDLDYTFLGKKYNVSIDINHQKTEFSDKGIKFPFNIPAKYERVE